MTLLAVRDEFLKLSGRFDLGTIAGSDSGANTFINYGQRFLDSRVDTAKDLVRFQKLLALDGFTIDLPGLRSIHSVWTNDGTDRVRLSNSLNIQELRIEYGKPWEDIDSDKPAWYALNSVTLAPLDPGDAIEEQTDLTSASGIIQGIVILPPTDVAITVEIWGKFFSKVLVIDADVSYWTEQYPDMLILAAMYKLETFYNNREGANGYLEMLNQSLRGLDADIAEQSISQVNRIEG